MEMAAERNMFDKYPTKPEAPLRNIFGLLQPLERKEKRPGQSTTRADLPPLGKERLLLDVPKSLYITSGYMPKLSDLRDALRNNAMYHNRFNPEFETADFKKVYSPAVRLQPGEVPGKVDEVFENKPVLEMLIPRQQAILNRQRQERQKIEDY